MLESYDFALSAISKLDENKLNESFKLFSRFELTRAAAFDKAFEHQTHQRGQTTIYLRLKGVKPPSEKLFSKRSQVAVTQRLLASMNNASGAAFAFNVGSKTILIRSERVDKAVQTRLGEFHDEAG